MRFTGRFIAVTLASAVMVTAFASPAVTRGNGSGNDRGRTGSSTDAGMEGGTLTAEATNTQIVVTGDVGQDGEGNLTTSGDGDWTPPVCWYEPSMTPTEFESEVERLQREGGLGTLATNDWGTSGVFTDIYRDNNPEPWNAEQGYTDYNLDKEGEGMWWIGVVNPNREDEFELGVDCTRDILLGLSFNGSSAASGNQLQQRIGRTRHIVSATSIDDSTSPYNQL